MSSKNTQAVLRDFTTQREWGQFHSPENLIKSISIESGELLECVQWNEEADPARIRAELADVLTYSYLLADRMGWDPEELILEKLQVTEAKYPVNKAKGTSAKYDQL
ncbi:nucleotide pyrophosphohydrolase [Nesterenkonia sp. CF4.4]|uniref:nucleotide pyrophosphohydrolase n=1 Tax=Nesterenkonia sp. CF4.4 TaxID=3373079 RepID=UPI003EE6D747